MGAVEAKVNRTLFSCPENMVTIPLMVVFQADVAPVPAPEAVSYVRALAGDLAVMCVGAGRPDAAIELLRVVLTLDRPFAAQPPEANAAPGDAA